MWKHISKQKFDRMSGNSTQSHGLDTLMMNLMNQRIHPRHMKESVAPIEEEIFYQNKPEDLNNKHSEAWQLVGSIFPVFSVIIPAITEPTKPTRINSATHNPEKVFSYPREHIYCSICVAKQFRKPIRPPRPMNNPINALFVKISLTLQDKNVIIEAK